LEAVTPYLEQMETSGVYALSGPLARQLEARHADRLGVDARRVVAVSSATAGLTGAVVVSGREHWTVPAFAFAAAGHAVRNAGGVLHLRDVDDATWRLPAVVADAGLLPVLPFGVGLPPDWRGCDEVVIDAAASLGASVWNLCDLPSAWTVVFSLSATKVMPCGEGGLVVCADADRAAEVRRWGHFRMDASRSADGPGANALMPEMSAAYALAALDGWETEREEWRAARSLAQAATRRLGLSGPPQEGADAHPYWIVRLPSAAHMVAVERSLARAGIASRRWWGPAMNLMPAFAGAATGPCPVAEALAETVLGLPLWRGITAAEVDAVADAVEAGLAHAPSR
jgi:dTDP-4-amino-4,6-dideoxygalactose transaminase